MNLSKIDESYIKKSFFSPNKYSNKYNQGKLLIIAGSIGMTGAACLSAMAAHRSGTGVVKIIIPKSLNHIFEIKLTESMTIPISDNNLGYLRIENKDEILEHSNWADTILIGPGLGRNKTTGKLVKTILEFQNKIKILDADGLYYLSGELEFLSNLKSQIILTPHYYEASRLFNFNLDDIISKPGITSNKMSNKINKIVVLKGPTTFLSYKTEVFENTTGNQGLATAGSGDVLAGIISSFTSQGVPPLDAAKMGVYFHGEAADKLLKLKGYRGMIASDLIQVLPNVLKDYEGLEVL